MKRLLILEDGSVYKGKGFGGSNFKIGELIFQTGMCGYQETISDVAYYGQIIMMTFPSLGGTGINRDDFESMDPQLFGIIVKEYCEYPSNFRSEMTIDEYLKLKNIPGVCDIDTREITRKIRKNGVMKAVMADEGADVEAIVRELSQAKNVTNGVSFISTTRPYAIPNRSGKKIVMIDLGSKYALIRELNKRGCEIVTMPFDAKVDEIKALKPDGLVISNGPGIPAYIEKTVANVRELAKEMPILGVGLGHLVIGEAFGAKTSEMKFGHHGNSTPIVNTKTNRVEFTAQNHRFDIDEKTLTNTGFEITHRALNDKSIEGIRHKDLDIIGVQFSPEASPGADDTMYIFDEFVQMIGKEVK